jgi:hypothetical protein
MSDSTSTTFEAMEEKRYESTYGATHCGGSCPGGGRRRLLHATPWTVQARNATAGHGTLVIDFKDDLPTLIRGSATTPSAIRS